LQAGWQNAVQGVPGQLSGAENIPYNLIRVMPA
jgi:hypothetical protein